MVDMLFNRYMWLLRLVAEASESGRRLTYEDIASQWRRSSLAKDAGVEELSKRTLYNHCRAIEKQFHVAIECRRGRGLNYYHIANMEDLADDRMMKWAFNSFLTGATLLDYQSVSHKILLENIPSQGPMLQSVLHALKHNYEVEVEYLSFFGERFSATVRPLCVRLYNRRWYVVTMLPQGDIRILGLDRLEKFEVSERKFEYPRSFDPKEFFSDYFGIFAGVGGGDRGTVEEVVLRAYRELPGYLRSLPLHHTQREIATCADHTDFSLRLVPTLDFVQELLMHFDQLEVLQPTSLREKIYDIILKMKSYYDRDHN